jgi:hypothetical protein
LLLLDISITPPKRSSTPIIELTDKLLKLWINFLSFIKKRMLDQKFEDSSYLHKKVWQEDAQIWIQKILNSYSPKLEICCASTTSGSAQVFR